MSPDPVLRGIIIILLLAGVFILASASLGITAAENLPAYYFLLRQFTGGGAAGLILFFIALRIRYRRWRTWALLIFIAGFLLTAAVFLPFGFEAGGARRWLSLGPFTFQPAEFLKFGFILYLAAWFSAPGRRAASLGQGLLPLLIIIGLAGTLLILQPDIGTLGVMALSGLFLFLVAGGKAKHVAAVGLLGLLVLAVLIFLEPYRLERILVFLNPDYDPPGAGYQVRQALIAIGSGGIFGRGFGLSRQKFQYLPEPAGDSIFAVAAEEFGFVGSFILILMFLAFAWRGFYVSRYAPDSFGKLFGSGLVILITVQSLVNIAALSGLLPLTGIPLIFISQGGSALAMTLLEVGILLNISKTR